jgi:hypothetical protein
MLLSPLTLFKSPSISTLLVFYVGDIHVTKGYCFGEEIGIQMIQNLRYFFTVQTQPIESSCCANFKVLASARIVLQYRVMQVRCRFHMELSCEN